MVTENQTTEANVVLDTLPQSQFRTIDAYDDVELSDEQQSSVPAELAGKTQAELIAEIEKRDLQRKEAELRVDPATNLANQFAQFLETQKPKTQQIDGYKVKSLGPQQPVDMEKWKRSINEKFLDDPSAAAQEVIGREVSPLLLQMAESQAMLSRELVRLDPETKDVYARFAQEIEAEVSDMDAATKLRNPRIYHAAVERVRSRHFSELVSETTKAQQEAIATEYLKSLGIDMAELKARGGASKPVAPVSSTLATAGRMSAPAESGAQKQRIVLNSQQRSAVEQFALARGVSVEAAATHLRAQGKI
jgi:hypothetical protein